MKKTTTSFFNNSENMQENSMHDIENSPPVLCQNITIYVTFYITLFLMHVYAYDSQRFCFCWLFIQTKEIQRRPPLKLRCNLAVIRKIPYFINKFKRIQSETISSNLFQNLKVSNLLLVVCT